MASKLIKKNNALDIVIVDPAQKHFYQPLWTLVSAGVYSKEVTAKNEKDIVPSGVNLIQETVTEIFPQKQYFLTSSARKVYYDYLVISPGLQINWNSIKGLKDSIGKNGVVSTYSYSCLDYTWETIKNFRGGNAIFTQPNTPYKCGAAPQKIMYLADDYFRKTEIRDNCKISFYSPKDSIFPVKKYAEVLNKVIERKDIVTNFGYDLIEIKSDSREAVFKHLGTGNLEVVSFDMLHVTPPMSAPDFIKNSSLSNETGWLDVDPYTLQHKHYVNIFGIGDVTYLTPTSKTGAAIRKQAPVLVDNLLSQIQGELLTEKYNGYTSCPITTSYKTVILAEFDYDNNPQETFPFDQSKERKVWYFLKKNILPRLYWHFMLKGYM